MTKIYRQGDVLIRRVDDVPRRLRPVTRRGGRLVLAEGEATGHAHVIDAPAEEATLLTDSEQRRFLRLVTDAPLVHEEHATVQLPAGDYEILRQREYDPERERFVAD